MSVALHRPMTRDEFFDWAERQDGKYEFDGSQPVAMVGGTNGHGLIAGNLYVQLRSRLRGGSYIPMTPEGGGIAVSGGGVRYPEAAVSRAPVDRRERLFPDPIVVFEVTSESTRRFDQIPKLREYHTVPTIRRYVLIEQQDVAVTVHSRHGIEPWSTIVLLAGEQLDVPEIGISIAIDDLYEDVLFDGSAAPA